MWHVLSIMSYCHFEPSSFFPSPIVLLPYPKTLFFLQTIPLSLYLPLSSQHQLSAHRSHPSSFNIPSPSPSEVFLYFEYLSVHIYAQTIVNKYMCFFLPVPDTFLYVLSLFTSSPGGKESTCLSDMWETAAASTSKSSPPVSLELRRSFYPD